MSDKKNEKIDINALVKKSEEMVEDNSVEEDDMNKKIKVEKDEPIALIFNTNKKLEEQYITNQIEEYISISKDKVENTNLIFDYKHN